MTSYLASSLHLRHDVTTPIEPPTLLLFRRLNFAPPKSNFRQPRRPPRQNGVVRKQRRREISCIPHCIGRSNAHDLDIVPLSPVAAIAHDFYSSLNEKNVKRLQEIIADDCVFHDLAFPKPFRGKEVHRFLKALTQAMGMDVKFIIDSLYEGKESSIAVRWHLEWQQKRIPFTTGCGFYHCSTNSGKLLIKEVCIFIEPPMKPGEFVLELLRFISSLFDTFPNQAKWFLKKPQALIQLLTKLYKIFIEPLIFPLLVYYTHLGTYGVWLMSFLMKLVQNLLKILK